MPDSITGVPTKARYGESLLVSYDPATEQDLACLTVHRMIGNELFAVKSFYAPEAEGLYLLLTGSKELEEAIKNG